MTGSALIVAGLIAAIGGTMLSAVLAVVEPLMDREGRVEHERVRLARLILIAGAAVGGAVVTRWWERPLVEAVVAAGVTAAFVLVLGHLLPRAAAEALPRISTVALPAAGRITAMFRPFHVLTASAQSTLNRVLPPGARPPVGVGERDMLAGVLSLREETVADVMTPRLDIEGIEAGATWGQVVEALRHGEHSRLPVYEEDLDDIVGILYAKDVTPFAAGLVHPPEQWHTLVRSPQYVPESKPLALQLRDFQRGPSHLAVVVDEFGGTAGVVTLEDVLEEVVGEIRGEYDANEEAPFTKEGADRFWVNGALTLDELGELLGIPLEREDIATVGGLIYSELGRVPRPGEELQIGSFRVVVEKVVQRRVRKVYFERQPASLDVVPSEEHSA
ncbi:MAG TPA: hemolysin family protein [Gemmatimonadales bacterium]